MQVYRDFKQSFSEGEMWLLQEPVTELDINDMPDGTCLHGKQEFISKRPKLSTTETGEIISAPAIVPGDASMLAVLARAELDTTISTAKAYPRSLKTVMGDIMSFATLDEQTATENIYALPRGGKPIRGASIRLAEIIQQCWGNCRVDARVIQIDRATKSIVAEGTFHDLETNSATRAVVQRRISDKRGRVYNDDMIVVTGNAACSIARRNAILAGVPKAVWRKAYEASEQVVAGDIQTLVTRREAAVKAFAAFGIKPEQIFAALEVKGIEDIALEHMPTLQGMFSRSEESARRRSSRCSIRAVSPRRSRSCKTR